MVIEYLKVNKVIRNQQDFVERIGYNKSTVSQILNGKVQVSDKFFNTIAETFPFIDRHWLHTGEGKMIKEETQITSPPSDAITGYYYPNIDASAGLNFCIENKELDRIPVCIPNWGNDVDFINVFGDSMYPKFQSGEIIGIKEIEYTYLTYGNSFVVVMQNGDVHLKYIKKGKDEEHVILASENSFYEDREFHISKIKTFYQVKGIISRISF